MLGCHFVVRPPFRAARGRGPGAALCSCDAAWEVLGACGPHGLGTRPKIPHLSRALNAWTAALPGSTWKEALS